MKVSVLLTTMIVFVSTSFAGDILTLNDNMRFDGKVTKIKDCSIVFKTEGRKYTIPASDIYSIYFEDYTNKIYTKYLSTSYQDGDNCLNARLDAENLHGKKGIHAVLGFLFGPFAMIGTAISKPTPDRGKDTPIMSKHKDQFNDPVYLNCYTKRATGKLITIEAIGWGAAILLLLII